MKRFGTFLVSAIICFLSVAPSRDNPVDDGADEDDIVGVYVLKTLNGKAMPAEDLKSASLTISSNGTYAAEFNFTSGERGFDDGTWNLAPGKVVLVSKHGGNYRYDCPYSSGSITMYSAGSTMVFRK